MATSNELLFIMRLRDEATRILRQHQGQLKSNAQTAKAAKQDFNDMAAAVRDVSAAIAGIAASAAVFRTTMGSFIEFERQMVAVAKTTGLAGAEFEGFQRDFRDLSNAMVVPREELAEIAIVAGQLGISARDDLRIFVETVGKMGTATNLAGEDAANALARMLNVMREPIADAKRLASVIVRLGNDSVATEKDIARMATEISLATAAFKIGTTNASALATAMAEIGLRVELSGTSVGRVFRQMDLALKQGGESLEALTEITGRTREELAEMFTRNPTEVFDLFLQGLNRVIDAGGNYYALLKPLKLAQEETNKSIIPLAANYERIAEVFAMANDEVEKQTALDNEYNRAAEALGAQLQQLGNNLQDLYTAIGADLAPTIKDAVREVRLTVAELVEWYESLDDATQKWVAATVVAAPTLGAVAVAARATYTVMGLLGVRLGFVARAFGLLTRAMLINPFGLAITAATVLTLSIVDLEDILGESVDTTGDEADELKKLAGAADEAKESIDGLTNSEASRMRLNIAQDLEDARENLKKYEEELRRSGAPVLPGHEDLYDSPFLRGLMQARAEFQSGAIDIDEFERRVADLGAEYSQHAREAQKILEVVDHWREASKEVETYENRLKAVNEVINEQKGGPGKGEGVPRPLPDLPPLPDEIRDDLDEFIREGVEAGMTSHARQVNKVRLEYEELALAIKGTKDEEADLAAARLAMEQQLAALREQGPQKRIAEAETAIRVIEEETRALETSAAALENYQAQQKIAADTEELRKSLIEAGVLADEAERLADAFERASRTRRAQESVRAMLDVQQTIRDFEEEAAALEKGTEAWEEYKKARDLRDETQDIRDTLTAAGVEAEQIEIAIERYKDAKVRVDELTEAEQRAVEFGDAVGDAFQRSATGILLHSDSAIEAVRNLTLAFAEAALQASFLTPVAQGFGSWVARGLPFLAAAKGHAFSDGRIVPFRKGGRITNGPELFTFQDGGATRVGLRGEAGTEGIFPLARMPNGDLGVQALTGGGTNVVNNVSISVEGGGGTPEQNQDMAQRISREVEAAINRQMVETIRQQTRPGNLLNPIGSV